MPTPTALLVLRGVGNTLNLSTPLGLLVAALGRARLAAGPRGLVLASGYRLRFPFAYAFAVGNVLLTRGDWAALRRSRPELFAHEERHSWQWLYCVGLPFLPAYALAMGWSVLRHGDRASGNWFERQAGLAAGGYPERSATV